MWRNLGANQGRQRQIEFHERRPMNAATPRRAARHAAATPSAVSEAESAALVALRRRPLGFLFRFIRRRPIGHAVILFSVLAAVVCSVSTQYGVKNLVDAVSDRPVLGGVWGAFTVLCLLIAGDNLMWRVAGFVLAPTFTAVTADVRADLFAHLAGHAPSYFSERLPGALASRISAAANAVFTVESTGIWNVIPPIVAVTVAIILVSSVNPLMALSLVGLAGGIVVLVFHIARAGAPLHRRFANRAAAVDGELVDIIGNFAAVRAFGGVARERARMAATVGREIRSRKRSLYYLEKLRLLHAVLTALLTAGLVGWGIVMWERGQATPGDLVLIVSLGFTILHSSRDLAVALVDLIQHLARMEEAISVLLTAHELPDGPDATPLLTGPGEVRFEDVDFGYPGRGRIVHGLNLTIRAGERVGLVGASGAGKSTLLTLLQRFYDPQSGRVLIDGQDIAHVTQSSLRSALAIVPQDVSMFNRTLLANLRYARPDASTEDVFRAAEMARCRTFIEALPQGFGTMVGDRGTMLSGGQRQRLAIARAMLKDSPILLLDEATSALDSESERAVQDALERLMVGRTVIAIAHRLSTLQRFDRIVVMDHGRIVDDGSPMELAARPGPYRDLLLKQSLASTEQPA
jgi:ATP-binding cassette, subfamily B, bacterial